MMLGSFLLRNYPVQQFLRVKKSRPTSLYFHMGLGPWWRHILMQENAAFTILTLADLAER